ncbi:MAG: membrane dipeptidase [Bacteroidetes bacterium QS_8_68_15]|nr:MAG: membrane dipeptidase [Bacteroidetes bacterium QS_8_68_15]
MTSCRRGDARERPVASESAAAAADTADPVRAPLPEAALLDSGAVALPPEQRQALVRKDSLWRTALRIHYRAIVFDGHADTPTRMAEEGYDIGPRHAPAEAHLDLPRMKESGLDAVFFSIYVPSYLGEGRRATTHARHLIRETKRQLQQYSRRAAFATTAEEVRRLTREGKRAVLLGLEGGHALAASEDTLRAFREMGVRYVTLTHIGTHSWADAAGDVARHGGLAEKGEQLVRAMNDAGVLADLSHVSDSTYYDALRVSEAPVILSHSSVRALTPNERNATDEMLRALSENGGLAMINFYDRYVQQAGGGPAALEDVLDHIAHAAEVAGVEHVGLGSDFDGVPRLPKGLGDVTRLPWITHGLLKRGYSKKDVYKMLGGNALRVLAKADSVAAGRKPAARRRTRSR